MTSVAFDAAPPAATATAVMLVATSWGTASATATSSAVCTGTGGGAGMPESWSADARDVVRHTNGVNSQGGVAHSASDAIEESRTLQNAARVRSVSGQGRSISAADGTARFLQACNSAELPRGDEPSDKLGQASVCIFELLVPPRRPGTHSCWWPGSWAAGAAPR